MNIFYSLSGLLLFTTVIINLILALLVFQNNPRGATNRVYSILGLIITAWLIVNYLSVNPELIGSSLIYIRLSIFFAMPLSTFFLIFASTIPSTQFTLSKKCYL